MVGQLSVTVWTQSSEAAQRQLTSFSSVTDPRDHGKDEDRLVIPVSGTQNSSNKLTGLMKKNHTARLKKTFKRH